MGQLLSKGELQELAEATPFQLNEIEALYHRYEQISNSQVKDDLIHVEEFKQALGLKDGSSSFFINRMFELFDQKQNDVLDFREFIMGIRVFHPTAPVEEKIAFQFRMYDLDGTGYIKREELKILLKTVMDEKGMVLSDADLEAVVDRTIKEADIAGDGRISLQEYTHIVEKCPSLLDKMTVHLLTPRELTTKSQSWIFNQKATQEDGFYETNA